MIAWACRSVAVVLAIALTCHADPAAAAAPLGFYVGVGAGLALLDDQPTSLDVLMNVDPAAARPAVPHMRFDPGIALVGSIGYGLDGGVRVEVESDWRRSAMAVGGSARSSGMFANALYEIEPGLDWVSPYLGLGVGWQAASRGGLLLRDGSGGTIGVASSASDHFAFQVILGVAVPVSQLPGLSITAEYRFVGNAGGTAAAARVGLPSGIATSRLRTGAEASHAVLVGMRYEFEHSPELEQESSGVAIPRTPMVGSVARTYVVYFEPDSAALDARARDVVAEAARASTHVAHTRLSVAGHTDRTGAASRRVDISRARADTVADELGRWGIARDAIEVHAFGDERPALETKPDVPEARNRRVEIFYQ